MHRKLDEKILKWCGNEKRKPLVLVGAPKVGKTTLLMSIGNSEFENVAYLNLSANPDIRNALSSKMKAKDVLGAISKQTSKPIHHEGAKQTLIVLDDVHAAPEILQHVPSLAEAYPGLPIAITGFQMRAVMESASLPIGTTTTMTLYPLSFSEFSDNTGGTILDYLDVGGMPAAVSAYKNGASKGEVRSIQRGILQGIQFLMAESLSSIRFARTLATWQSISRQLCEANAKFIYGHIKPGARARDYAQCVQWLVDAGVVYEVPYVSDIEVPLSMHRIDNAFKLYMYDVGLMSALAEDSASLAGDSYMNALAGQFSCQELITDCGLMPYCWSAVRATSAVDFLVQDKGYVFAINVFWKENRKSKSLQAFRARFKGCKPRKFAMYDSVGKQISPYDDERPAEVMSLGSIAVKSNWE